MQSFFGWARSLTTGLTVVTLALGAGTVAASARPPAPPRPTSPAYGGAPFAALRPTRVADVRLKAKAATSFAVPTTGGTAVVLSVSVTDPAASGGLIVYPYGAKRPGVVSVSLVRKHASAATVVVAAGANGRVAVDNATAAREHVVVTIRGYYAAAGTTPAVTSFVAVPARRIASLAGRAGAVQRVVLLGKAGVASSDVVGVVLSVTVQAPTRSGALVLYPYGAKAPKSSTFGFTAGRSVTSLVIVKPGSKGRAALVDRAKAGVRVYLDVVGYLRVLRVGSLQVLRVPGAPTAAAAVATIGGATVSWQPPTTDGGAPVTGYHVVAAPGGAAVDVAPATTSASFPGLSRGTTYTFTVTARNSIGSGPAVTTGGVAPQALPGPPTGVTARGGGTSKVTLSWAAPADSGTSPVTGYRVTASPGGTTAVTPSTSATLGGLTSGQQYTVTVATLTAVGESPPSRASGTGTAGGVSRASVGPGGVQGTADSDEWPSISADGRYVAFAYDDASLVGSGSTEDSVYVRDRLLDTTTLVSVTPTGQPGNGRSEEPSISADGRYVAFASRATDLVASDGNGNVEDIFVRDLVAGVTTLVSKAALPGNDFSFGPMISADGSHVAFESDASNFVVGDTNGKTDIYEVTLPSGAPQPVSLAAAGGIGNDDSEDPAVSADGRYVAWDSDATNLVTTPSTSGTHDQVYRRDMTTGTTVMISSGILMASGDESSNGAAISGDGNLVAFASFASNVESGGSGIHDSDDIYLRDVAAATTTRISQTSAGVEGDNDSERPSLSTDGRWVVFASGAQNLVPGVRTSDEESVFRFDRQTGLMQQVSVANDGNQPDGYTEETAVSADGQHAVWSSGATNLVPGDTNARDDIFVSDLG